MDAKKSDELSKPAVANVDASEADRILEENQKKSTSGLNWDEVAEDDKKKGWRQITEIGEGD